MELCEVMSCQVTLEYSNHWGIHFSRDITELLDIVLVIVGLWGWLSWGYWPGYSGVMGLDMLM